MDRFDYVVIGGGTAGSVVAGRLSEDGAASVLLLERAEDTSGDETVRPVDFNAALPAVPLAFLPVETLLTRELALRPGLTRTYVPRALGGGPAVSGSFWGRGDPADYDDWAALGNDGWAHRDLLPFFQRSEHHRELFDPSREVSPLRGVAGPIEVAAHDDRDPDLRLLLETFAPAFGVPIVHDHCAGASLLGAGPMQRSLGHDPARPVRSTPYRAYVERHLEARPRLRVETAATATRIRFEGPRAVAVEYLREGRAAEVAIGRELVIAAGAIHSPKLLLQSGIGPAAELAALGVPVHHDLPGVGRNLHDHVRLHVAYQTEPARLPPRRAPSPVMVVFFRSPGSDRVDMELAMGVLPGGVLRGLLVSLRSDAAGSVRLASRDPLVPPRVALDLDPTGAEAERLISAYRTLRAAVKVGGLASRELYPGTERLPLGAGDAAWKDWLAGEMDGFYHLAGTCKMGPDADPAAVVDPRLRLRGAANVRVADCSVMPRVVASHPSATAVMIGEKAAAMIMAR